MKIKTIAAEPKIPQKCVRCCAIADSFNEHITQNVNDYIGTAVHVSQFGNTTTTEYDISRADFSINFPICSECAPIEHVKRKKISKFEAVENTLVFIIIIGLIMLGLRIYYLTDSTATAIVIPILAALITIYPLNLLLKKIFNIPDSGKLSVKIELGKPFSAKRKGDKKFITGKINEIEYVFNNKAYQDEFINLNRTYILDFEKDIDEKLAEKFPQKSHTEEKKETPHVKLGVRVLLRVGQALTFLFGIFYLESFYLTLFPPDNQTLDGKKVGAIIFICSSILFVLGVWMIRKAVKLRHLGINNNKEGSKLS